MFILWIIWWNTAAYFLWMHWCIKFMEPTSIISFRKKVAISCFTDVLDHNYLLVNHLLLIFSYKVCNSRVNNTLSIQIQKCAISQIKYIEETISENDLNKKRKISNRWKVIDISMVDVKFRASIFLINCKSSKRVCCVMYFWLNRHKT